jgi:hypothetical protein
MSLTKEQLAAYLAREEEVYDPFQELLGDRFLNTASLFVAYGDNVLENGKKMKAADLGHAPDVTFSNHDPNGKYTIMLVDLDYKEGEFLHWCVHNIPGDDGSITGGKELCKYELKQPDRGTGQHRYLLYLFQQEAKEEEEEIRKLKNRRKWDTMKFIDRYNWTPVAGVFFYSENSQKAEK